MNCLGRNNPDHCCYVNGKPCPFLEENSEEGSRWSCGLRRELGSWDAVIRDSRYAPIGKFFSQFSYKNCKNYQCKECGSLENGDITQEQFNAIKAGA